MKNTLKYYIVCWIIAVVLFNVLCFIVPINLGGNRQFTNRFWIGYAFIMVAFICHLFCSILALHNSSLQKQLYMNLEIQKNYLQRVFYSIPLMGLSYLGLISMLVVGSIFMMVPFLPEWIGAVFCMLVLVYTITVIIKAKSAADIIEDIDNRVKMKTQYIGALSGQAENLLGFAKSNEAKRVVKRIYDALRYSDPMSNSSLFEIEIKIQEQFSLFSDAVVADDTELFDKTGEYLLQLINDRNKRCRLLK